MIFCLEFYLPVLRSVIFEVLEMIVIKFRILGFNNNVFLILQTRARVSGVTDMVVVYEYMSEGRGQL